MKAFLIVLGAAGAGLVVGVILRARHEPRLPVYVVLVEIVCVIGFLFGIAYTFESAEKCGSTVNNLYRNIE